MSARISRWAPRRVGDRRVARRARNARSVGGPSMSGKRPPGPVIRNDLLGEADMPDTALQERYEFLAAGAELAAHLTVAASEHNVEGLGTAVVLLTRDQLEAACMAFALLAATGSPVVDPG